MHAKLHTHTHTILYLPRNLWLCVKSKASWGTATLVPGDKTFSIFQMAMCKAATSRVESSEKDGKTLDNKFAIQLFAHSLDWDPFLSLTLFLSVSLHIKLAGKLVVSASDCQFKIKFDFGTSPRVKSTMMMNNLANLETRNSHHNNGAKNKSTHRATLRIRNVLRAKKITLAKASRGCGSKFDLTMGKRKWFT